MLRWVCEATSEMNNKECFDPLVMFVIGARKESGTMHVYIYLSQEGNATALGRIRSTIDTNH